MTEPKTFSEMDDASLSDAIDSLSMHCHAAARARGWWDEKYPHLRSLCNSQDLPPEVVEEVQALLAPNVPRHLMLCVSELAEALEGDRRSLMDEHLPAFTSLEVELADLLIRVFDLSAGLNLRLGEAFSAKLEYNAHRPDHSPEVRSAKGGKKY